MRMLAAASAFLLAFTAGEACAHARLIRAAPRVGSTAAAPHELKLCFSETIDATASAVSVKGPAGPVATAPLRLDPRDPRVVLVPLPATLAPGTYRVDWRMTSEDTHETEGDFRFRVAP